MKIFDLHCDTLYKPLECGDDYSFFENDGHITEQGLIKGNYLAQCFAIFVPANIRGEDGFHFFKSQYRRFEQLVKHSNVLNSARNRFQILENKNNEKLSAVLTVENADFLNGDLERIKTIEDYGVKILGLIHNGENCLGFPHSNEKKLDNLPLKPFGREVVDAVNYTDMLIDVSHLNYGGFLEVASLSKKPFLASHSACRELQNHSRNLCDEQIKMIANSGGIIGVPFYSKFLNRTNKTEICDIIRHIEHIIKVGGEEVAAIGTDFDGMECELFLKNCSQMPLLTEELIKKFGHTVAEKICFKNALRII